MRSRSRWAFALLFSLLMTGPLAGPLAGQGLDEAASRLALLAATAPRVELATESDVPLLHLLTALENEAIEPLDGSGYRSAGGEVVIIPLRDSSRDAELFLYYRPAQQDYLFLRLGWTLEGGRELRLWGRGPQEIWLTETSAVLVEEPSERTFRLSDVDDRQTLEGDLTPGEIIDCIVRVLGISINPTTLATLLSSAACTATNTIGLAMTAMSCLDITPSPSTVAGCTLGLASMISCNFLECGGATGACRSTISLGSQVNGSWAAGCNSAHRAGRYARYYTFTLSSPTRVQIDVSSLLIDSYVYLLSGAATNGAIIELDDDDGFGLDAQIIRTLPAGTYTIEATTYSAGRTGSFSATVRRL